MNVIASRFPAVRNPLTEIDLCGWIGQAAPGDILEYHRGFLALDTMAQGTRLHQPIAALTLPELEAMAANAIARFIVLASHRIKDQPDDAEDLTRLLLG